MASEIKNSVELIIRKANEMRDYVEAQPIDLDSFVKCMHAISVEITKMNQIIMHAVEALKESQEEEKENDQESN